MLFLLNNSTYSEVLDTSKPKSSVRVYSFHQLRQDDILTRKVFLQFQIYLGDSLILSVGELFDKPAELSLPFGTYRFKFFDSKEWRDAKITINSSIAEVNVENLFTRKDESKRKVNNN